MNQPHKTTIKDRMKNAWRSFKGDPLAAVISYGVEVKQCKDCKREEVREGIWLAASSKTWECSFCRCETDTPSLFCPWCGQKQEQVQKLESKEGEA